MTKDVDSVPGAAGEPSLKKLLGEGFVGAQASFFSSEKGLCSPFLVSNCQVHGVHLNEYCLLRDTMNY